MYSALLAFSGAVYPDRLEYVDRVLQTCHNVSCQLPELPTNWLVVFVLVICLFYRQQKQCQRLLSLAQAPAGSTMRVL